MFCLWSHLNNGGVFSHYRSKLEKNKERDVSEKIALGLPTGAPSQDSLFDQRLFNQSKVSHVTQPHSL